MAAQQFLLFSYLDFRVYLACYPPESFKIIRLTCIWSKCINTSFHGHSSQSPQQNPCAFLIFQKNSCVMYRSNRSFNIPPRQPPGHLTFLKIIVQIPPYPDQNTVQMPPTRLHSGDQMPPPRDISQAHKWQKDGRNAFSCRTKSL